MHDERRSFRPVAVALGSNLGDRMGHLARALRGLEAAGLEGAVISSVYASAAVGFRPQPEFLNAVVAGQWSGTPDELLAVAQGLEEAAGRSRPFPGAPRTLDVDLILVEDEVRRDPHLTLPHPRWKERAFVLAPLDEIAPHRVDPESGETVHEIWSRRRATLEPAWVEAPPSALRSPPT